MSKTIKNYTTLIQEARPILLTLIRILDDPENETAERILQQCSMDVISTVTVVTVIGQDNLVHTMHTPVRTPSAEFKAWAKDYWWKDASSRQEDIEYLCSKRHLGVYLLNGMRLLNIQ